MEVELSIPYSEFSTEHWNYINILVLILSFGKAVELQLLH